MNALINDDMMQAPQENMSYTELSPIYTDEISSMKDILEINQENILQGVIFSEILGKPKSIRIGR